MFAAAFQVYLSSHSHRITSQFSLSLSVKLNRPWGLSLKSPTTQTNLSSQPQTLSLSPQGLKRQALNWPKRQKSVFPSGLNDQKGKNQFHPQAKISLVIVFTVVDSFLFRYDIVLLCKMSVDVDPFFNSSFKLMV